MTACTALPRRAWLAAGLTPLLAHPARAADDPPLAVRYPLLAERPREAYGYQMLAAALARSGVPHRLLLDTTPMSARAAVRLLELGELPVLDLGLTAVTATRFEVLLRPLDLGFSGARLLLGKPAALRRLARQPDLDGLRTLSVGQGPGWTDSRLLRQRGLRVEEAPFSRLLPMLQAGRFDLCALGAEEAERVLARHAHEAPDVAISDALALHMPFVRVFCLHRGQARLKQALDQGLTSLAQSGELRELLGRTSGLAPYLSGQRSLPRLLAVPDSQLPAAFHQIPAASFHPALRATLPRS